MSTMAHDTKITIARFHRWLGVVLLVVVNPACLAQTTETVTYYYTNQQGTPLATADASGNILTTSDYRPYGSQVLGSPQAGPGYTGHVDDPDSGLVYMQARYYDPVVGRFLGADPADATAGDPFAFNRFSYVNNNPVTNTDPDGQQCAQCLYYGEDIDKQAKINAGADQKALIVTAIVASVALPELIPELLPVAGGTELVDAVGGEAEVASTASKASEGASETAENADSAFPDRDLPRAKGGEPAPEPDAAGPHTQLGRADGRYGRYKQAREFDKDGKPVRDIDFTEHRPGTHPNPHQHRSIPNKTGGTPSRGRAEPLPQDPIPPVL